MARIEKAIDVDVPLHTAYNQWTQFEDFPHFMEGVKEVKQIDDTHLYWHAEVAGKDKEWEAEITEQVPDEVIAWRSTSGTPNGGRATFYAQAPNRTRVSLEIDYEPEGFLENVGDVLGIASRRIEGDLKRFKEFVESRGAETGQWRGEIHHGQPAGGSAAGSTGAASSNTSSAGGTSRPFTSQGSPQSIGSPEAQWSGERERRRGERRMTSRSTSVGQSSGTGAMQRAGGGSRRLPGSLQLWNEPFETLRRMSEEMDRMFEGFGSGRGLLSRLRPGQATIWQPQVEVSQEGNDIVICADLPGLKKDDVQVEFDDGMLTIEGERRQEREESEGGYRRTERSYGRFYRVIPLPEGVDVEAAKANMRDGVLEIRIPAPQRKQSRRLEIQGGEQPQSHPSRKAA